MKEVYEVFFDSQTGEETKILLTKEQLEEKKAKSAVLKAEEKAKAVQRQAVLDRLGLTAEEAALILG
jgi:hypothetical protein